MKKLLILILLISAACQNKEEGTTPASEKKDSVTTVQAKPKENYFPDKDTSHEAIPIGTIAGKEIVYDCHGCTGTVTDHIVAYAKNGAVRDTLFTIDDLGGNYIDSAEVLTLLHKPFVYIHTSHTYGHSKGYLFSVNINKKKAYPVKILPDTYKIPDSLYTGHVTYSELEKDKNNDFSFNTSLHSANTNYTYSGKYKLVNKGKDQYVLKPYGSKLLDERENVIKIK